MAVLPQHRTRTGACGFFLPCSGSYITTGSPRTQPCLLHISRPIPVPQISQLCRSDRVSEVAVWVGRLPESTACLGWPARGHSRFVFFPSPSPLVFGLPWECIEVSMPMYLQILVAYGFLCMVALHLLCGVTYCVVLCMFGAQSTSAATPRSEPRLEGALWGCGKPLNTGTG